MRVMSHWKEGRRRSQQREDTLRGGQVTWNEWRGQNRKGNDQETAWLQNKRGLPRTKQADMSLKLFICGHYLLKFYSFTPINMICPIWYMILNVMCMLSSFVTRYFKRAQLSTPVSAQEVSAESLMLSNNWALPITPGKRGQKMNSYYSFQMFH